MAETAELAFAICQLVNSSPVPVPITLMNHGADDAAAVIGAVVEQCQMAGVNLAQICVDPELALELGLKAGSALPHGSRPNIEIQAGLGRNVIFMRG